MARRKIQYSRLNAGIVGKIFGANLARIRRDLSLSREALAEKLGVSGDTVRLYELGINLPPLDRALDIARALNVPLVSLIGEAAGEETALVDEAQRVRVRRAQRAQETLSLLGFTVQQLTNGRMVLIPPPRMVKTTANEYADANADLCCTFEDAEALWQFTEKAETDATNRDEPLRPLFFEYLRRKKTR